MADESSVLVSDSGPGPARMSATERLGLALQVICRRGCYMDYPLASLKAWLLPAAQLHQLHVFAGEDRRLLGYMTWAWFGEDTERRWKSSQVDVLHISEWNEGDRLWLIDFVAMPGHGKLCAWLARSVFPPGTIARSLPRHGPIPPVAVTHWSAGEAPKYPLRRWRVAG